MPGLVLSVMAVKRQAVVMAMAVRVMQVLAFDLQGGGFQFVLGAGHMNVGGGFFGATKQQARFRRGEVGQHGGTADKGVGQVLKAMWVHTLFRK